ncbi:T9SS type A sorting domain-containing protein [Flaviaesturariibacter amylovorans]|uniref:DUF7619 domain-containing protein n=1 Tax=Flaviaesturariibacter amylovorans TaxID=1084520 RepID=A0ABP8H1Z7_9BACT
MHTRNLLIILILTLFSATAPRAQGLSWTQRVTDSVMNQYLTTSLGTQIESQLAAASGNDVVTVLGLKQTAVPITFSQWQYRIRVARYTHTGTQRWARYFTMPVGGTTVSYVYDLQTDKWGNSYILMRNFTTYNGVTINDGVTTPNCLVKIDAQGKLLWRRAVGALEQGSSAQVLARLAIHPAGNHFYAYVANGMPSLRFLDSTYLQSAPGRHLLLARIDSSGRILQSKRFLNGEAPFLSGSIDVNAQDEVLLTGSGSAATEVLDTTINVLNSSNARGSFLAKARGSDLSRIWVRRTVLNTSPSSYSIGARFRPDGNLAFLFELSRWNTEPAGQTFIFGADTVQVQLPFQYEMPWLFVADADGRLLSHAAPYSGSRTIVRGSRLHVDAASDLYYSGGQSVLNPQGSERFVQTLFRATPTGQLRNMTRLTGIDSVGGYLPQIALAAGETLLFSTYSTRTAAIYGADTLPTPAACQQCTLAALSGVGTRTNTVRGTVYRDQNRNGQRDAGERGMAHVLVSANSGAFQAFTDSAGRYLLVVDSGSFAVKPQRAFFTPVPAMHSVVFATSGNGAVNKDFAMQPHPVTDVSIHLTATRDVNPGRPYMVYLQVRNNGGDAVSGAYQFIFSPGQQTYQSSTGAIPSFVGPNVIGWNYSNLPPDSVITVRVQMRPLTTSVVGSRHRLYADVSPLVTDTVKADNVDSLLLEVRAAFDPNDKQVFPAHNVLIDSIQAGQGSYQYVIRFQNTGNDTAYDVHLADTLAAALDYSSLKLLAWSHPVQLEWKAPNVLHFWFRDIYLPDSTTSEPNSHGFVRFSIRPKASLGLSDTIRNRASIYFDYNGAVLTNYTASTFRSNVVTAIPRLQVAAYELRAFPNPAAHELRYRISGLTGRERLSLRVVNGSGQTIRTEALQGAGTLSGTLSLDTLPGGLYYLQVIGARGNSLLPFIKQ